MCQRCAYRYLTCGDIFFEWRWHGLNWRGGGVSQLRRFKKITKWVSCVSHRIAKMVEWYVFFIICWGFARPESTEWFMKDQAFLPLYELTPTPPLTHPSRQSSCVSPPIEKVAGLRERRGGAKSYDGKKAWFSINNSILSGTDCQDLIWRTCWNIGGKGNSW
jgi:hypothetical protein